MTPNSLKLTVIYNEAAYLHSSHSSSIGAEDEVLAITFGVDRPPQAAVGFTGWFDRISRR
jgi:hypothetical protein